jgi:hypothetical protein
VFGSRDKGYERFTPVDDLLAIDTLQALGVGA